MLRPWTYKYFNQASSLLYSTDWLNYPLETYGIFSTQGRVGTGFSINDSLVIQNNGYAIFSVDSKTYCLDINGTKSGTGYTDDAIVWTRSHATSYASVIGDVCYLCTGSIYAVNALTGEELWIHSPVTRDFGIQPSPVSQVLPSSDGNLNYMSIVNKRINPFEYFKLRCTKVDITNGIELNSAVIQSIDGTINQAKANVGTPSLAGGNIYVTSYMGKTGYGLNVGESYCHLINSDTLALINILIQADVTGTDDNVDNISTGPAVVNSSNVYFSSQYGLFKCDFNEQLVRWWQRKDDITKNSSHIAISEDNQTIYYRSDNYLYAIQDDGATYSQTWKYSFLPISSNSINPPPIIDNSDNIIVPSGNNSSAANLHIFGSGGNLLDAGNFGGNSSNRYVSSMSMIGSNNDQDRPSLFLNMLDTLGGTKSLLYVLNETVTPVTTTTTTPPPGTSSSSSSGTDEEDSSSSSETGEVTTTTTYPPPLSKVITSIFINKQETEIANGSDSPDTVNTPLTNSLTFGIIAPKEISETVIVTLKVPYAKAIRNVKLALIDTGGLEFATNRFGITSSYKLDNTVPTTYFQGVNEEKLESSPYNVIIDTQNDNTSNYVYLNVKMPDNNFIGSGTVRYKWWFDFSN